MSEGNQPVNLLPPNSPNLFYQYEQQYLKEELPTILNKYFHSDFVTFGGLHVTSTTMVSPPLYVEGFTNRGNRVTADGVGGLVQIDYGAVNLGVNVTADTCWVIASARFIPTLPNSNFQQVANTYIYVNASDVSQPILPDDALWLMKITITNNQITDVRDLRKPRSFAVSGVYDVTDPLYNGDPSGDQSDPTGARNRFAFRSAINAGSQVFFPSGTYWIGEIAGGSVFDVSIYGSDIKFITSGIVKIVCKTTIDAQVAIFKLGNNPGFHSGPMSFEDIGFDISKTWHGAMGFYLNNTGFSASDFTFDEINCYHMVSGLTCFPLTISSVNRLSGIHIHRLNLTSCYYGINCQNDGDNLVVDSLTADDCIRAYFCYGVSGHTVNSVYTTRARATSGHINISRSPLGLDTHGIVFKNYVARNCTDCPVHFLINHIDLLGGVISGVDINLDIKGSLTNSYFPVKFVNYTGSGGSETTAASSNYVEDIRLTGSCDSLALNVSAVASYAQRRQMTFHTGLNFLPDVTLLQNFQFTQQSIGNTGVTWRGNSSDPSIGNGTLNYSIFIANGMALITLKLIIGTTTTLGSGFWYFTNFISAGQSIVPVDNSVGSVLCFFPGRRFVPGTCFWSTANGNLLMYFDSTVDSIGAALPLVWQAGDSLYASILLSLS